MTAPSPQRLPLAPESMDQRVRLHGVPWETYEALLVLRGEGAVPRITYLEGELELMTPSLDHEGLKKRLARLLEAYAEARGIALEGFGSWTLRKTLAERGLEPDECYLLGVPASPPERPDIAIEVVWTSGGIDKLAVYRGLGVPEVWFRQDGALSFYGLSGEGYRPMARSQRLPELDPELIARCMAAESQTAALHLLRQVLRNPSAPGR